MFKIPDNVSKYTNVYDVLQERGFIEQVTDPEAVRDLLGREKIKFYIGFDPTADCLHVGHLVQIIVMLWMLKYGHTPVALIGGGTGMVGDPSGRTDMRRVMTLEEIDHNCDMFKKLFDRFLDFDEGWKYEGNGGVFVPGHENREPEPGKAVSVNNAHWLRNLNFVEFVSQVGKNFSVPNMLRAEAFKRRINEGGLTFYEFTYMLMQAYDFYVMARDFGLKMQFGGNDQWSNIIAGVNLSKKASDLDVYGMTFALLTKADGQKMGNRLSALEGSEINKAKEVLAYEVTRLVHGDEKAREALEASRQVFVKGGAAAADIPSVEKDASEFEGEGVGLVSLMKELGVVSINSDGFRTIEQGGVKLNDETVTDKKRTITKADFKDGRLVIQKGKKKFMAVDIK